MSHIIPRTFLRYLVLLLVVMLSLAALRFRTSHASNSSSENLKAAATKEAIRMFDIGLGPHAFNFQLGRETKTQYLGSAEMRRSVQSEQAQPRSMVTDDFNGDGMGDRLVHSVRST